MHEVYSSPPHQNFLTGYYDANVISGDHKYLLSCKVTDNFAHLKHSGDCQLCLSDLLTGKITVLQNINCFNFQQGCRSTFFSHQLSEYVIFNHYSPDIGYHSRLINLNGEITTIIPCPIYTHSEYPPQIASIDMRRHDILKRGYSYGHYSHMTAELKSAKSDSGLRIFNLDLNRYTHIVALLKLPTYALSDDQFFDHPLFSPDGSMLAFYHRIKNKAEVVTYLYTLNLNSGKVTLLHRLERGTHFNWADNKTLIIWGSLDTAMTLIRSRLPDNLRKPLIRLYKLLVKSNSETGNSPLASITTGDSYYTIDVWAETYNKLICNCYKLDRDGHPSIVSGKNIMVTDTYPDDQNICKLICIDLNKDALLDEKSYIHNHLATRTPFRADLHPKVSISGKYVTIDTFEHYRQVKVLAI